MNRTSIALRIAQDRATRTFAERRSRWVPAVCALALVTLSFASAQSARADSELVPGLHDTTVSGFYGSQTTSVGAGSSDRAVSMIEMKEHRNRPCYLSADKASLNGGTSTLGDFWNGCDGNLGDAEEVGYAAGSRLFVRGVAVCLNRDNDRVKGVQLYPAFVWDEFAVAMPATGSDGFARANCHHWDQAVYCEPGQVASKIRIHRNGDEMVGLSLACRIVEER